MKNSQLEMINRLENNIKHAELKTVIDDDSTVCLINDIDMAVSLIKEQQEKIAKYEKIYKEYDCYRWVKELNKKDKQIDLIKEYAHQEIVHYTETIKDYIDDDKEGNKHYIEELKEEREHWRDIEKILQNKPKEELYMNWWKYGLYE